MPAYLLSSLIPFGHSATETFLEPICFVDLHWVPSGHMLFELTLSHPLNGSKYNV